MAILQRAFFLLLCALLLLDRLTQADIYHLTEESASSSSSRNQDRSAKKEIKIIKDKTQMVIGGACMTCAVSRKFMGSMALDVAHKFMNVKLRMMYAVVHICGKIIKCIGSAVGSLASSVIAKMPPCTQKLLNAIKYILGTVLNMISEATKIVFNFTKEVAKCTIGVGKCIGSIFGSVFQSVMEVVKSIIRKITEIVKQVLGKKEECPPPPEKEKDPEFVIVVCGTCAYCAFKPDAAVCPQS